MQEETKKQNDTRKKERLELWIKALTPIVAGLLIAWAGFVGNLTLSSISSKEESARLITELQVKREQAESDLRKDIFDQALKALLKEDTDDGSIESLSKRVLRIELLALNFGDSLSLSPLFAEVKRDLDFAEPIDADDAIDHPERVKKLQKRLTSLAKKVASAQLSSVGQHGHVKEMKVPLLGFDSGVKCGRLLYDQNEYKWPEDEAEEQLSNLESHPGDRVILEDYISRRETFTVGDISRFVTLTFSKIDHCNKQLVVHISIERPIKDDAGKDAIESVTREFKLDFFNFPKVDNTRLSGNQRFSIVMEEFDTKDDPRIEIAAVIFPAEYSSLRDRPSMQEAIKLLQSAMDTNASIFKK